MLSSFQAPTTGYGEQLIYHTLEADADGMANVAVINPAFGHGDGYGVYYRWTQDTLPYMVEWKMMGRRAYVLGIEPAVNVAKVAREKGVPTLRVDYAHSGNAKEEHFALERVALEGGQGDACPDGDLRVDALERGAACDSRSRALVGGCRSCSGRGGRMLTRRG